MNGSFHFGFFGLLLSIITLNACSFGGSSTTKESAWNSLFDGHSFDGWTQRGGTADYKIEDGSIVGTSVRGTPNSFMTTTKNYSNFILEFDFKVDKGLNSGVQFRSLSKPEVRNGVVHGYQFEIDTSERAWSAGVFDEKRRGWLYTGDYSPSTKKQLKLKAWNKARVECDGNVIRTYLNGKIVSHLIDDKMISQKGFIGLQVHSIGKPELEGLQIRWKNIRIKELKSSLAKAPKPHSHFIRNLELNSVSEEEQHQGWSLLFDAQIY